MAVKVCMVILEQSVADKEVNLREKQIHIQSMQQQLQQLDTAEAEYKAVFGNASVTL